MTLPARIPKKQKRASRWRSQAHCNFVRGFACCNCGAQGGIELAHVRFGSGAGIGQKPDDWRAVSLCFGCHRGASHSQHSRGEPAFWRAYRNRTGQSIEELIAMFIKHSPKRFEIERIQKERANV